MKNVEIKAIRQFTCCIVLPVDNMKNTLLCGIVRVPRNRQKAGGLAI